MTDAIPAPQTGAAEATQRRGVAKLVDDLHRAMARSSGSGEGFALNPGEVAALRRGDRDHPAFWKVMAHIARRTRLAADGPARDRAEAIWRDLLAALALMAGFHRPGLPLGAALAEAGVSEPRLVSLLRARDEALSHRSRTVARALASKGQAADLADLARLLLHQDGPGAEPARRRVARAYYTALHKLEHS